jgi:hypothetical protein
MQIIKKINPQINMSALNDSVSGLRCYGVSIESLYTNHGIMLVKGITGKTFGKNLFPTDLTINIHMFLQNRRLRAVDYAVMEAGLCSILEKGNVVLSSPNMSKDTLIGLRNIVLAYAKTQNKLSLAFNGNITQDEIQRGDMLYSRRPKILSCGLDFEFDRVIDNVNEGVPVLLDWPNNDGHLITGMLELTDNSPKLLVLSQKPQTTRKIEENYKRKKGIR